jgi:hypothetical protein
MVKRGSRSSVAWGGCKKGTQVAVPDNDYHPEEGDEHTQPIWESGGAMATGSKRVSG